MANTPEPADERQRRFQEIVADYYEAEEAGTAPDRQEWLARYPEFAAALEKFFHDHDQAKRLAPAPPGRPPSDDAPTGPDQPGAAAPDLETIRYFGDYELLAELGEGGMGRVYKARQKSLDRLVALKLMKAGPLATREDRQRFHIETEAVAALDHPNIVPIYEVNEHDGQPYFTMKYLEGGSLKDRQQDWRLPDGSSRGSVARPGSGSGSTPPPDRVRRIAQFMVTVARAVQHAHERGILHRDLKPANILLAGTVPYLSDFGLAKKTGSGAAPTLSGAILGTPSYMAPEQVEGQTRGVTTRADVYSLGAILYELLTGQPPFRGATAQAILRERLKQEPPPAPRKLNAGVPRDLETICLKCLQMKPEKRYASAEELALDLERFLNKEPIKARRVGLPERAWLWCRRHPARVALTVFAVVLLLVVAGVWFWVQEQNAAQERETKRQARAALEEAARLQGRARATHDPEVAALATASARRAETLLAGAVQDPALLQEARGLRLVLEKEEGQAREQDAARKKNRRMSGRLEECRFLKTIMSGDGFDTTAALAGYEDAFREYGIDPDKLTAEEAAARVKASPLRAELAGELDGWGLLCVDVKVKRMWGMLGDVPKVNAERAPWLFKVARTADDGDAWRNALRATLTQPNLFTIQSDLTKLARSADVAKVPPPSLALLGESLGNLGNPKEAVAFLRRAQAQHPGDPWLAYWLALHLTQQRPPDWDEAIRFWQASYALCPTHAGMIFNIGYALQNKGDLEGAAKAYRKATELRPDYPMAHQNLGLMLASMQTLDEAAASILQAIRWRPKYAEAHFMLGVLRKFQGRYAEARDALEASKKLALRTHPVRAEADKFLKECDEKLALVAKLPLLVKGELRPCDAAEGQRCGEVCFFQEHYLASARFYESALAAKDDTVKADEMDYYLAACAAARVGCGQGKDAGQADAAERVHWRGKALAWLTTEFARAKKQRESPATHMRAMAPYVLRKWQNDPHLAGVRDKAAVAMLPQAEQQVWSQMWADVKTALTAMAKR